MVRYRYVCEDSLEGILSAVHAAYMSRKAHSEQAVVLNTYVSYDLFSEMIEVATDIGKAKRVADAIGQKISWRIWYMLRFVAMSAEPEKGDMIYRFLVKAFKIGPEAESYIADPDIFNVIRVYRAVSRETQRLYGFVRFKELENGVMFSKIAPKHRQVILLAPHFADRFPMQNWMIYDELRHEVCVHEAGKDWYISQNVQADVDKIERLSDQELRYEQWWKTFYDTIGIKQRKNDRCRMTMMPKMYWRNMSEMHGER